MCWNASNSKFLDIIWLRKSRNDVAKEGKLRLEEYTLTNQRIILFSSQREINNSVFQYPLFRLFFTVFRFRRLYGLRDDWSDSATQILFGDQNLGKSLLFSSSWWPSRIRNMAQKQLLEREAKQQDWYKHWMWRDKDYRAFLDLSWLSNLSIARSKKTMIITQTVIHEILWQFRCLHIFGLVQKPIVSFAKNTHKSHSSGLI